MNLKNLKTLKNYYFLFKPLLIMFLIYLLAASALLLAGVHYADDVARTRYGYPGWSAFSRYISTAASPFLHADFYLTNIAPLPQILALFLLSVSSLIVISLVSGIEIFKRPFLVWFPRLIAVLPLVLSPYYLECLSYQYDAPYMALSILFVVFPLLFREKSRPLFLGAIAVGMLGASMTYQASLGIFIVLVIFLALKDFSKKKDLRKIFKFLLFSAGGFLVSLLFFQKVLMRPRDVYASNEVPSLGDFFPNFFTHLSEYYTLIFEDFKGFWLVLIGLIILFFIIIYTLKSNRNKFLSAALALAGVALILVAAYAPYCVITRPIHMPRAMYPIGAVIAVFGLYLSNFLTALPARLKNLNRPLLKLSLNSIVFLPVLILSWCFFVFSFTYGNALKEQSIYHDSVSTMTIYDLNELLPTLGDTEKTLQISGQIDLAPTIAHMPQKTRHLLNRLLEASYGKNVPWMGYRLIQDYWLDNLVYSEEKTLAEKDLPVLKETVLYTIKGNSEEILVEFKGENFKI